jgi:hypothetical protein
MARSQKVALSAEKKASAKIAGKAPAVPTAVKDNAGQSIPNSKFKERVRAAEQSGESNFSTSAPKPSNKRIANSPTETSETSTPVITSSYPSHELWDNQLQRFVNSAGQVDYKSWKKNEEKLNEYLKLLAEAVPAKDWQRNEAKAYWLNAYNAFTVKLILKNYPVAKITDLNGGQPWKVKWIELAEKSYSLDQIENEIIRPTFQDARIHFAVNCAAESCPPLYNRAFQATGLDATLNRLTRSFINNDQYNQITASGATVSKIFEWYAADFGTLNTYLNRYSNTELPQTANIDFGDYDWSLNDL